MTSAELLPQCRAFVNGSTFVTDPKVAGRVSGAAGQNQTYFTAFGVDRRNGQPVVAFPMSVGMAAGGPTQTVGDGLEVYGATCMNGCDMPDVEMEETSQPGMILWRRVAPDTGGAGAYRGGLGVSTCLAILHCDRMTGGAYTNTTSSRRAAAPAATPAVPGRRSSCATRNIVELLETGVYPTEEALKGRSEGGPAQTASLMFKRGDVYTVVHGGGGGVGDPLARAVELVAKDVADGYVSAEAGKRLDGVVSTTTA